MPFRLREEFPPILHWVLDKDEPSLVSAMAEITNRTASQFETLFHLGAVYIDKVRAFAEMPLPAGAYVRCHLEPKRFDVVSIDWPSRIVHESDDFLVLNKPSGVPVHATVDNARENALTRLSEVLGKTLLITHRLDVPTSGLMVLAKTAAFQRRFHKHLAAGKVQKTYRCQVRSPVSPGSYTHFMKPSPYAPKLMSAEPVEGWMECRLRVLSCVSTKDGGYELRIDLDTGRTHQIRAQMALLGAPIDGDPIYGTSKGHPNATLHHPIALQCQHLSWDGLAFTL